MSKRTTLFYFILFAGSLKIAAVVPIPVGCISKEYTTDDAAWCWFSDPRAIYHKGINEQVYYGFVNSRGDVGVSSFDLETGKQELYLLHPELQVDDHNVPSFLVLPDGNLLAFYNHHNGNIFMRKSKYPESVREWEEEVVILQQDSVNRYCYTNPVMLSGENNRIYLFGRNIVRNKTGPYTDTRIFAIYSDDFGKSWSSEINLFENEGRNTPQYVKYASDNKSRIDFLFTNGHPKQGNDISVYHAYYQDGVFRQTNGASICSFGETPIAIASVDKVYDAVKNGARAWIWDIALDEKNHPVVTYARYPSEMEHRYHYARWDGSKWNDQYVTNAGNFITHIKPGKKIREAHYSGGIVLDHADPSVVFLSKKKEDRFELERRIIGHNGTSVVTSLTVNSSRDNLRPYVIEGKRDGAPLLMWMEGFYYHYTDFDTGLKMIEVKPVE